MVAAPDKGARNNFGPHRIHIDRVFERILVALDGTPSSFAAALFAASVARPKSGLHLLCVADRSNPPISSPGEPSLTKRCEQVLAAAQAAVSGRASVVERIVRPGRALAAILAVEEEIEADLICVGSGAARIRPGRVSTAVAREARASIAILREGMVTVPRISRLAVGLRRGPTATAAARHALRLAAGTRAALTLFRVVRAPAGTAGRVEEEQDARLHLDELANEAEQMNLARPRTQILYGEPSAELLRASLEMRADALFVGAGARRPLRPLGRVVSRLIARCTVPLVVCRNEISP